MSISIGGRRAGLLAGWTHKLGLIGLAGVLMWLVWTASVSVALLRPSGVRQGRAATQVAVA